MGKSSKVLFTVIVCALMFTGGIVTGLQTSFAPAFAASDKTLESECAKKEKANDIDHFFCVTIFGLQNAFADAGSGIQEIIDLLTNPNFGLEEIKKEVSTIETEVLSEDHGLAEIKSEVRDIEARLASMQEQLDQIQNSLESCPNECSGNGVCLSGSCLCDAGFSGVDCSVSTACPNNCSGNGVCVSGSCFCNSGFSGADCSSSSSSCPNNCSGHGVCSTGSCFCDTGYSGIDCSVPPDDNFCITTGCDDGNQCTADSCNEGANTCQHTPLDIGTISCGVGACFRTVQACVGGNPNECIPGVPNPEVCNGIDDDCDGTSDEGLFDTNPSCNTATAIGTVSGDTGSSTITFNGIGEKWFRFFVSENDNSIFSSDDLGARITLDVPFGIDYDLFAYCDGCGPTPVASSTSGPGVQEQLFVRWDDQIGGGDSGRFILVEVQYRSGNSCEDYRLTVNGNVLNGPDTCSPK